MIVTSEAVVLRGRKFRDTSRIVTLYTRRFGKLSVVAKGARELKSRFGASLEPMSVVQAVFYHKEQQELHLLSQCDLIRRFRGSSLDQLAAGMAVVELVDAVAHGEERQEPLFTLLVETLEAADRATKRAPNAFYMFAVKLADLLGFRPDFHACHRCGRSLDESVLGKAGALFLADSGACLCPSCRKGEAGGVAASTRAVRLLQRLADAEEPGTALTLVIPPGPGREIRDLLRFHLRSHVGGLHASRAEQVFDALC